MTRDEMAFRIWLGLINATGATALSNPGAAAKLKEWYDLAYRLADFWVTQTPP